jgi:chromosome segregation ATPase
MTYEFWQGFNLLTNLFNKDYIMNEHAYTEPSPDETAKSDNKTIDVAQINGSTAWLLTAIQIVNDLNDLLVREVADLNSENGKLAENNRTQSKTINRYQSQAGETSNLRRDIAGLQKRIGAYQIVNASLIKELDTAHSKRAEAERKHTENYTTYESTVESLESRIHDLTGRLGEVG